MKFKNIVAKKTYVSNGEEKTTWLQVGTLRELDDGKQFIELNMNPDVSYYVFDQKAKTQPQTSFERSLTENQPAEPQEEVSVEDIPF